ncbi:unnamed protein product [Vicia faba]|uniref:Uncharacterized protein n=1 Tax=Vicia faba TaxID=3906 RepID=A0AAV0YL59_VICFA|nr:unnamed protein product [Vicia faba]
MKVHEIIKPEPRRTFSSHSPWLNGKHSIVKPIVTFSSKDSIVAKDESSVLPVNGDGDYDVPPSPSLENSRAMWWESLLNECNDKIGPCCLLQEERDSILELSNVDNFFIGGPDNVADCY